MEATPWRGGLFSFFPSSSVYPSGMNWLPHLLVLVSILAPVAGSSSTVPRDRGHPRWILQVLPDRPQALPDSVLDQIRTEYRRGRYWHGVRRMREALGEGGPGTRDELTLLAQGEAGWGNWSVIPGLLQAPLAQGLLGGSLPWFLLGRAFEEAGDAAQTEASFTAALASLAEEGSPPASLDATEIHLRRARVRMDMRDSGAVREDLDAVLGSELSRGRWLALELAQQAAEEGKPEETMAFLSKVTPEEVRQRGWELPALALLASGDSAGSEAAFWGAIPSLRTGAERSLAWEKVGALRLARLDTAGAKSAFHQVLQEDPRGGRATTAASSLLALGFDSSTVARTSAEALARAGRAGDALEAYQAHEELLGGPVSPEVTLARIRALLEVREPGRALELLDSVEAGRQAPISAPHLTLRIRALGALGRTSEARAVQDSMIALFPDRAESVEVLFLRADARQDQGDIQGAIQGFEATAALSPSQNLAGQARMRLGQIHLSRGRPEEAVHVFQAYMEAFPEGRRWDEAAFWAGRTLLSLGREEDAYVILDDLRRRFPLSYYSVQAGLLLEKPFDPGIPVADATPPLTERLIQGLGRIDALREVGLLDGADWEFRRLSDDVRLLQDVEERRGLLLRLALEMNRRGMTREGINLGWEIRRLGGEWDRDLLSSIYPFPYREMVVQMAEERGLDPYLIAGLMRQESAFWHRARSRADARGLMQVLPSTGRELARAGGPRPFNPDEHLYRPEINVHLGMTFFSDMKRRFGEDLSIVLSAYNAGPTRARRWRNYPEAGDLPRFVERIPFSETRGYVKNVLLNREIYTWLYSPRVDGG